MKNTIGFLSAFLVLLGVLAAQGAAKTYDWTGAAGDNILNTAGNWSPERTTPAPSSDIVNYIADGAADRTVSLSDDFSAQYIYLTNRVDATGRQTINLDGHALTTANSGWLSFWSSAPMTISNGVLNIAKARYGREDMAVAPDVLIKDAVINAGSLSYGNSTFNPMRLTVKDSASTNFPCYAYGSNMNMTFDNTYYYIAKQHLFVNSGSTNVTLRFINGSQFDTANGDYVFGTSKQYSTDCRFSFESGSELKRNLSIFANAQNANNILAFTNSTFTGWLTVNGTNNVVEFVDSTWTFTGTSGTFPSLYGVGNRLMVRDAENRSRATYIDVYGVSNSLVFADNTVFSNTLTVTTLRFRSNNGACDESLVIGTNCSVRLSSSTNSGTKNLCTNTTIRIGKNSQLLMTGRGDTSDAAFGGTGSRISIEGRFKDGVGTNTPRWLYAGITLEFLGDDAEYVSGYGDLQGSLVFGAPLAAYPDLESVIRFVPGPDGFHGQPPLRVKSRASSQIMDDVIIEVDLRGYLPTCGGGVKRVPLFLGTATSWVHFDLDKMNENLKVVTGNRLMRDARLVYDKDLNAIVLEFKPVLGLMILVR